MAARAVVRRTLETVVGEVELARPYFYCAPCGQGFSPLDAALSVAPGRKQFDLQQAAATLAAEGPYETAQALFKELTEGALSTARRHELINTVGKGLGVGAVGPPRAEIAAKIAAVAEGRRWRPRVGLAIEGAAVPTRPETAQGGRPRRKQHRAKRARWQGPSGAKPRGFASPCWTMPLLSICSVGIRSRMRKSCSPRCGRSKRRG